MSSVQTAPLLFYLLMTLLLGWLAWAIFRNQGRPISNSLMESHDNLRLWLLLLAVFSLGVFVTYILEILLRVK